MSVNLSDPLGAKTRFVLHGSEGINEVLTGSIPDGSALTTETTSGGVAIVPGGSWSAWRYVATDVDPAVTGDFTYHWYGVLRDDAAQGFMRVGGASYGYGIGTASYSPGVLYMYLGTLHSGYAQYSNLTYGITDNSLHSITVRYTATANKVEFFLDGVDIGSGDFWKDPDAMGSEQNFSITGHATKPYKHIVSQVFKGALSNAEIARLVADPFAIFIASPKTLVGVNVTQANTSSPGLLTLAGNLAGLPCNQANTASGGRITRTQVLVGANCVQLNTSSAASSDPYKRLRNLLKPVAKGEWLQVNTSTFLDCTMPRSDDAPGYIDWSHFAILNAWPSVAWDTEKGELIVWGGGHANYIGNEIYIWSGDTGKWRRGSLPSLVDLDDQLLLPNKDAPQSSHTYSNNVYLPNNKMFCTFGGAASPSGGPFRERTGSNPTTTRNVGPWCFDLALADPDKVGGASGTGWDKANVKAGSNAWYNRIDMVDGGYSLDGLNHINSATVCVDENGKDVCYFTMDNSSGFPYWYRYEFGDIRAGGRDTFSYLTGTQNSVLYESWGVFDTKRGMFYRGGLGDLSGTGSPAKATELAAVHVSTAAWNTYDTPIRLVDTLGQPLPTNISSRSFGAAYGEHDDLLYLWTGWESNPGTYYTVAIPEWNSTTGWASTTWVATKHVPTGPTPVGNYQISILGRMRYVPALKAVVIVDQPRTETAQDAGVWMLKTTDAETVPINLSAVPAVQANATSIGAVIQMETGSALTAQQSAWLKGLALLHGLVYGSPLSVSDTARSSGDVVQAIAEASGTVTVTTTSAPSGAPGLSKLSANEDAWLESLARIYGLIGPLTVTANTRSSGAITQVITESAGVTTVTRL